MMKRKLLDAHRPPSLPNSANRPRDNVPWTALEQQVVRAQKQIAQACQRGDTQTVHSLQQQLMESEAARLLAVRRVAEENQGKHTAGVDGVKSLSARERLAMATAIHPDNWKQQPPLPVRRVWIAKPGTLERRPLAVLPMIDRCKQALVKLALEPEWEVKFETHSYGYRPGRGPHDAIAAILVAIERRPSYVFDADIEGAFEHVNQEVILAKLHTFPALRHAIHGWFTAGILDGTMYMPSDTGIAQGGVLSPLLMNIALHGMETVVTNSSSRGSHKRELPLLVRYADDFVIVHSDLAELQQAVLRVRQWLAAMGLQLRAEKTRLTHTLTPYRGQVGFDFLGFTIRQEQQGRQPAGNSAQDSARRPLLMAPLRRLPVQKPSSAIQTIVSPAREASERHLAVIEQRLQQLDTASQARVIAALNPLITGWSSYYNGLIPAAAMGRYDDLLEQRLLHWASQRHPGKARDWLRARYWRSAGGQGGRRSVFATQDGIRLRPYRPLNIL